MLWLWKYTTPAWFLGCFLLSSISNITCLPSRQYGTPMQSGSLVPLRPPSGHSPTIVSDHPKNRALDTHLSDSQLRYDDNERLKDITRSHKDLKKAHYDLKTLTTTPHPNSKRPVHPIAAKDYRRFDKKLHTNDFNRDKHYMSQAQMKNWGEENQKVLKEEVGKGRTKEKVKQRSKTGKGGSGILSIFKKLFGKKKSKEGTKKGESSKTGSTREGEGVKPSLESPLPAGVSHLSRSSSQEWLSSTSSSTKTTSSSTPNFSNRSFSS